MNKEFAIKKINQIGKGAGIATLIVRILVCIGMGLCLIGIIGSLILPKRAVTYRTEGTLYGYVDINKFTDEPISKSETEKVLETFRENGDLSIRTDSTAYGKASFEMTEDGIVTMTASEIEKVTDARTSIFFAAFWGLIMGAIALVTSFFLGALCRSFATCSTPFSAEVIRDLKRFAYSMIPWIFMNSLSSAVTSSIFRGHVMIHYNFDISMVIVILVVLALAYIFSYGAVLQRESDETL